MSDKDHDDFGSLVCIYAQLLPKIREAGKTLGYAIAIHGSMSRDLDLLAAPWIENAQPAEALVEVIADAVRGFVIGDVTARGTVDQPTIQPHGRRSWNICWGGNPMIDLSVMPREITPQAGAGAPPEAQEGDYWEPMPDDAPFRCGSCPWEGTCADLVNGNCPKCSQEVEPI